MAPYEPLYGRRCKSHVGWLGFGEAGLIGKYLVHQATKKVKVIQEMLKMAESCQMSYTGVRRSDVRSKYILFIIIFLTFIIYICQF